MKNYFRPIPYVIMMIEKNGKILVCKRGKGCDIFKNKYELPQGKVEEEDETPSETAKREALEELNLIVTDLKFRGFKRFKKSKNRPLPGLAIFYTAKTTDEPEIKDSNITNKPQWLNKNEVAKLDLTPGSRYFIENYL